VITNENKDEWFKKASTSTKLQLEKEVMKASGRMTKPLSLELTLGEHEFFHRVQEVLCAKLDHYPTKEEALSWMMESTLKKIDPVRKADRSQDRSVEDQVNFAIKESGQAELQDGTKCGDQKWTHQHHVIAKEFGGPDTAENLVTLCASHHRMVHRAMEH